MQELQGATAIFDDPGLPPVQSCLGVIPFAQDMDDGRANRDAAQEDKDHEQERSVSGSRCACDRVCTAANISATFLALNADMTTARPPRAAA